MSLLLNICDGFVINTKGPNKDVKANIAHVIGTTLDSGIVKYGASMLGIPSNKMYDVLAQERHEIDHYVIKEGSLIVMPGTVLDMMQVYEDLDNHIVERDYDVRCFGYDPYNAKDCTLSYSVFCSHKTSWAGNFSSIPTRIIVLYP